MQKIGVFVCHCGTNIAGTVDVRAVAEALGQEPGVVFATEYQYMCSEAGQKKIIDAVHEYSLDGIWPKRYLVIVTSPNPRANDKGALPIL